MTRGEGEHGQTGQWQRSVAVAELPQTGRAAFKSMKLHSTHTGASNWGHRVALVFHSYGLFLSSSRDSIKPSKPLLSDQLALYPPSLNPYLSSLGLPVDLLASSIQLQLVPFL